LTVSVGTVGFIMYLIYFMIYIGFPISKLFPHSVSKSKSYSINMCVLSGHFDTI